MAMQRRGWVEVTRNEEAACWDVYDWSEHHDSGLWVGSFSEERDAKDAALNWAADNNRKCFFEVVK
jgi:hypothetical protein